MHIRDQYKKMGIENFYKSNADSYENPHERIIQTHLLSLIKNKTLTRNQKILDLCCGTGQVTSFLNKQSFHFIEGCDPYTNIEYQKRTNKKAYNFNFKQIGTGSISNKKYDVVICSFALHLCDKNLLPQVLFQLSLISKKLIIITPHKKPNIDVYWTEDKSYKINRVTTKVYSNLINL